MFWWFERNGHYLRCEATGLPAGGYELRIANADGSEAVERFERADDLTKRQEIILEEIARAGWTGPYGWVI